eukprot:scaffold14887_cov123-Isochrysis_galbana.AAC.2
MGLVPRSAEPGSTSAKEPLLPRWPHDCCPPGGADVTPADSATPIWTPSPNSAFSNSLNRRGCLFGSDSGSAVGATRRDWSASANVDGDSTRPVATARSASDVSRADA